MKKYNVYTGELGELFEACPKAVFAAIAVSSLTVGGDYLDEARRRLILEWHILHLNGIVPQPVPAAYRAECKAYQDELDSQYKEGK